MSPGLSRPKTPNERLPERAPGNSRYGWAHSCKHDYNPRPAQCVRAWATCYSKVPCSPYSDPWSVWRVEPTPETPQILKCPRETLHCENPGLVISLPLCPTTSHRGTTFTTRLSTLTHARLPSPYSHPACSLPLGRWW